jgi:hypothetical protein
MISDTLSDAADELKHYLHDEAFADTYCDPSFRSRMFKLIAEMDLIRMELDTPPPQGNRVP